MARDTQIVSSADHAAPKDYTIPGNAELILRAVQATFTDNGASGDWLPCVTLITDSGHTIARAIDRGVVITAGSDASVSWFPGVKASSGGAAANLASQFFYTVTGHVIPDATPTAAEFDAGSNLNASSKPFTGTGTPPHIDGVFVQRAAFSLTVNFPAGGYHRYIEYVDDSFFTSGQPATWRVEGDGTTTGDSLTLTGLALGNPFATHAAELNIFQASGGAATVQTTMTAYELAPLTPA